MHTLCSWVVIVSCVCSLAYAFNYSINSPTECGDLEVNWQGEYSYLLVA